MIKAFALGLIIGTIIGLLFGVPSVGVIIGSLFGELFVAGLITRKDDDSDK